MLKIVATETLLLPTEIQTDKEKRITAVKAFEEKLLHQIYTFNQANFDEVVLVSSAAIEVLIHFAIGECAKNSIDANASKLTTSIYLVNGEVIILLTDDGLSELNHQALSNDEYRYLDALSRGFSNKIDTHDSLGGAGKGLAMSAQYLLLSAKCGILLAGSRANQNAGFVVVLSSENKPARYTWNTYLAEFGQFASNISSFRQYPPALRDKSLRAAEKALCERMTERTCRISSDYGTFFHLAAGQSTELKEINFMSPVTATPS